MDTMRCPICGSTILRKEHHEPFTCKQCGWKSGPGMNYDALKALLESRRKK